MILLHVHNSDSILDGLGTQLQNAEIAASLGQTALAESNHATLSGSLKHIKACNKVGIQPINSVEGYFRPNRLVKDKDWRFRKWHYLLHAKNLKGWHNLIKITSEAFSSGFYQFPCFDWELLEKHHEGLIASTACILGPLPFLIENGSEKEVDDFVIRTKKIFGEDFYISIMPHDFDRQRTVNLELISIANKHGVPIVYEGDSHYPKKGWVETQKIAILIGTNSTVADAEAQNKKRLENNEEIYELWHDGLHIMGEDEVRETFARNHPDIPINIINEAISNTDYIGSKIEPFLMDRSIKMPRAGKTPREAEDKVIQWCWEGMERVGKRGDKIYEDRLKYELDILRKKDNFPYMYLVADWIRWCKSDDPLPGKEGKKRPMLLTCRGSAAASIVCYLTNITAIDPITHKFKFERFINPERKGQPDIDIDLPSKRRNEAKQYVAIKYGENSIADIMAQQHFQPRAALKGATKVLYGFDSEAYTLISKICHEDSGLIDAVHDIDLEKMRGRIPELDEWANSWTDAWAHAVRMENSGDPWVSRLCIAGDTVITPGRASDYPKTIAELYDSDPVKTWKRVGCLQKNGLFGSSFIEEIYYAGEKDTYEVFVGSKSICATLEHKFKTSVGYKELKNIKPGDYIAMNGRALSDVADRRKCPVGCECGRHKSRKCPPGCKCPKHEKYKCKPGCECKRHTPWNGTGMVPGKGAGTFRKGQEAWNKGLTKNNNATVLARSLEMIGNKRGKSPEFVKSDFSARVFAKYGKVCKCGKAAVHAHHKLPPRLGGDQSTDNGEPLCRNCHLEIHNDGMCNWYTVPVGIKWCKIDKIVHVGIRDCYDMAVKDVHNYVANGFVVHNSKHAAGTAITPGPVTDFMPTIRSDENEVGARTAWSETSKNSIVEEIGIVKIDALGISGLDQHEAIIDLIKDRTGEEIDIDNLPCLRDPNDVDPEVMALAQNGINLGVNQFSGNGISNYLKKLIPNNIIDLTAANALYRPGGMGEKGHLHYAERKNGHEEYSIPGPLQHTLSETYGVMAFQEQVMEIFQVLMGYSAGQADDVRKTIDKENRAKNQAGRIKLASMKAEFIKKASEIIGLENSDRQWDEVLPWTGYGFNRPHSSCYSIHAYKDWFLKLKGPLETYTVLLSEFKSKKKSEKERFVKAAIKEAKYFGVKVLPPDVNISNSEYTPDFENNALRYGMIGIKGIAEISAEQVMELRPYFSLEDFEKKHTFKYSKVNKGHRDKLLKVGALDSLGARKDWSDSEKSAEEIELLGISLSPGGTLGEDESLIISKTHSEEEYNELEVGSNVVIGGIIAEVKAVKTKRGKNPGQDMGFCKISLGLDSFQCTLFPAIWSANKPLIHVGSKVMVNGRKDERGIIVENMMSVEDFVADLNNERVAA